MRYAIFVTGPPASGKSTVAEFVANALPAFVLLQKDVLKEALFEVLHGNAGEAVLSRQLSDAAIRLLWTLAPKCPRVILEANFRTLETMERERFQALDAKKLEVHCSCPFEVARRRFAFRATERHPAHTLRDLSREIYEESEAPFGLSPLIQLDTTSPVDLPEIVNWVRRQWPEFR